MDVMQWLIVIFSGVVAVATVVYMVETVRLRRAQCDPVVLVSAELLSEQAQLICVTVHNVGRSTAFDVRFEADEEVRRTMLDDEQGKRLGFFDGFSAMAPGERVSFLWGNHQDLVVRHGERCFDVIASYAVSPGGRRCRTPSRISLDGRSKSLLSPPGMSRDVAQHTRDIKKKFDQLLDAVAHLKVDA